MEVGTEDYLDLISGKRGEYVRNFHKDNKKYFNEAAGSSHNHQNWEGGYRDHVTQCLVMADQMYCGLADTFFNGPTDTEIPDAKFESAVIVLYFHDVEKMYRYSSLELSLPDKWAFLTVKLKQDWEIEFSHDELNALKYVHGEGDDYRKDGRVMGRLAAICHAADVLSSRVLYDRKKPKS